MQSYGEMPVAEIPNYRHSHTQFMVYCRFSPFSDGINDTKRRVLCQKTRLQKYIIFHKEQKNYHISFTKILSAIENVHFTDSNVLKEGRCFPLFYSMISK